MSAGTISAITGLYLLALFLVAQWGKGAGKQFLQKHSGIFYSLGLAVYATGWTFYGSIGRAATHGLDFLAIYLGPVVAMPIWWMVTKKMVRISKTQHLNSLSDFITARFGKSWFMGLVVTLLVVFAITPYLALQIKAISSSANVLLADIGGSAIDLDLLSTVLLLTFTMIYGLRFAFGEDERYGLIAAIGFESLIKLIGAFIAGWIVVSSILGGMGNVFEKSMAAGMEGLLTIQDTHNWWWLMLISSFAFILLPRQYQMGVVSNKHEKDLKKALWIMPLYLLLMNWWVVPIALGGNLLLDNSTSADYHFLRLSLLSNSSFLPGMIFLGGLAACTSMIIVSSSALGAMVSSNILIPLSLKRNGDQRFRLNPLLTKRIALVVIFTLAYGYYTQFVHNEALVSIGIVSFIGIAQLAPGMFTALFWRRGNRWGVISGLIAGLSIWFITLVIPQWSSSDGYQSSLTTLFEGWSPVATVVFISLLVNSLITVGVSLATPQDILEKHQADIYYNILQISRNRFDENPISAGKITFDRLERMLQKFIPDSMLSETLYKHYTIDRIQAEPFKEVPSPIIGYAERLLTQIIGPAAARIVLSREIESDTINTFDLQDIIAETKETQKLNLELQEKTKKLAQATEQLTLANEQLKAMGQLKDDFLYTVTHELRSPLTAIRAQIEIIRDDDAMPLEIRHQFLDTTIEESERLTKLISNVLDIEKFESGNQQLQIKEVDLSALGAKVVEGHKALATSNGIELRISAIHEAVIKGDEERLQQVFVNLLSNAIKYATAVVEVRIVRVHEGSFAVMVKDDGPGVPHSDIPHLFEKFYQSGDQTVKKRMGTGLGLAISCNIIKAHRGHIELAHNTPEEGTVFLFELPVNQSLS